MAIRSSNCSIDAIATGGPPQCARSSLWMAARSSNRILTVSEASKRDILRFFDVPPEKIAVIYNGIDDRFRRQPPEEEFVRVRERYQLQGDFVLYAGNVKPHKNLSRLLDAFARVQGEIPHDLMIVGRKEGLITADNAVLDRIDGFGDRVAFTGYVSDARLKQIVADADGDVTVVGVEGLGRGPRDELIGDTIDRLKGVLGGGDSVDVDPVTGVVTIGLVDMSKDHQAEVLQGARVALGDDVVVRIVRSEGLELYYDGGEYYL